VLTSPGSFQQQALSSCVKCKAADRELLEAGKRSRGVGLLLAKVLLYGGDSPDESDITDSFEKDLNEPIDAVIIVGTRLRIPSLKRFTQRLCETVKSRGGTTLWVSNEPSRLGQKFQSVIDFEVLGDCDAFPFLAVSGC
jgi:NAD-dependent SIR2 family protein deacetylase